MNRRKFFGLTGAAGIFPGEKVWACETAPTSDCGEIHPAPGHLTQGSLNQDLTMWVWVCHPDFNQLAQPRWWSYIMTATEGYMPYVHAVMSDPRTPLPGEVEVHSQECRQQHFSAGWRVLTVSNCRRADMSYVFLLSRPLTAADHGRSLGPADFTELPYVFAL